MGACASSIRASDDGASTSEPRGKPEVSPNSGVASINPARVLNLGADAESYFAESGGREFYSTPSNTKGDAVGRNPAAVERSVTFESLDGTVLAGVLHKPAANGAESSKSAFSRRTPSSRHRRRRDDDFDDFDDYDDYDDFDDLSDRAGALRSEPSPRVSPPRRNERDAFTDRTTSEDEARFSTKGVGVVLCHPHPFLGGSKDAFLVVSLARRLAGAGVTVLRFDSRGVGSSQGKRTWRRDAEIDDCRSAVRRLAKTRGVDSNRIHVVGYGLGAAIGLEASTREETVSGFVALSYPFGAKSMLVPSAHDTTSAPKAVHMNRNNTKTKTKTNNSSRTTETTAKKLFVVAGSDVVGFSGDRLAVAAYLKTVPPPRSAVVVDDADHAFRGFHDVLYDHVLKFVTEHARDTVRGDGGALELDDARLARGRASPRDVSTSVSSNSAATESKTTREDDDADEDSPSRATIDTRPRVYQRRTGHAIAAGDVLAAKGSAGDRDGILSRSGAKDRETEEEPPKKTCGPFEILGWDPEARSRARAATTANGRPFRPTRGRVGGDRRSRRAPSRSGDDDGHGDGVPAKRAAAGAAACTAAGFETWDAWDTEPRRWRMGSPGHTPGCSRGSTPRETPKHSPGQTPLLPRSAADSEDSGGEDSAAAGGFETWAINGAPPLFRSDREDVPGGAAVRLEAFLNVDAVTPYHTASVSSDGGSDSGPFPRPAGPRRAPVPGDGPIDDDGGPLARPRASSGTARTASDSFRGYYDGSVRSRASSSGSGSPSSSRSGFSASGRSRAGAGGAAKKPILKLRGSYGDLRGGGEFGGSSVPETSSRERSAYGFEDTRLRSKSHGRPNAFRSGIRAVLAANRFVAAGQKRVRWEQTTSEGRPIVDAVYRKPTRLGDQNARLEIPVAAKAITAGNRLGSFVPNAPGSSVIGRSESPFRLRFLAGPPARASPRGSRHEETSRSREGSTLHGASVSETRRDETSGRRVGYSPSA